MKTITIRKSYSIMVRSDIFIHSNIKEETLQMKNRSVKIIIDENEFIWFTLRWWGTRKYRYDFFEEAQTYELVTLFNNCFWVCFTFGGLALSVVYMNFTIYIIKCVLYFFLLSCFVLFILTTVGGKRYLRLKKVVGK